MQVSIETLSGLERRMTIEVPSEQVESQVQKRLQEATKTVDMKGFRKGKVPLKVIAKRFGPGVRQEVVGELMSQSYYEAVTQEKVNPAGQPRIEAKSLEAGKNLEFTATFEVYPEFKVADFAEIKIAKKIADIKDSDVDSMIETLRVQKQVYVDVERASKETDQVNIDFVGTMDGEKFEGGEAQGSELILGSKNMIAGFEDGLLGAKKDEEKILSLNFPEDYQNKDFAGKAVVFTVHINSVAEVVLPELNDEFFAGFDITEGGEKAFREEVSGNMARELKSASRNDLKAQVIAGLLKTNEIEVPKELQGSEVKALREQTMQRFGGGGQIDPAMLPDEMFQAEAENRVAVSLILNEIIASKKLTAAPGDVQILLEEMAEGYEDPEEVIKWYSSNKEQMANIESMALENAVIELVLETAQVNEIQTSYEDALKPTDMNATETDTEEKGASKVEAKPKTKAKAKTKAKPKAKAKAKPAADSEKE